MISYLLPGFPNIRSLTTFTLIALPFQTCIHKPLHQQRSNPQQCHDFICTLLQGLYRLIFLSFLPMYPGVPEVSWEFSGLHTLAIPKSVILKYPKQHWEDLALYLDRQEPDSLAWCLCEWCSYCECTLVLQSSMQWKILYAWDRLKVTGLFFRKLSIFTNVIS